MVQEPKVNPKYVGRIPMQFAYRELLSPGMGGVAAGIVFFLLVQYTVLGPLGTGRTMGWMGRLAYWGLVGALQFPVCYASGVLTLYVVRHRRPLGIALGLVTMVLILAVSCTAITFTIYGPFQEGRVPDVSLGKMYGVCVLNVFCASALMFYVLWLRLRGKHRPAVEDDSGSVAPASEVDDDTGPGRPARLTSAPSGGTGAMAVSRTQTGDDTVAAGEDQGDPESRVFDRLPAALGRDVIYLKASAHYVEVITTVGADSVLIRFADAVAELGELGMRVHRSYWVAYRHVKQAARREGHTLLHLTGDHEVPVGRSYLSDVRAAVPKNAWIRARRRRVNHTSSESRTFSPSS